MPVKLFFCYTHEDEPLLNKLKSHLRPLQRQGLIDIWHDRNISAGTEWEREISKHLNEADIILLLVSPDFMNSEYCYGIELKRALKRQEKSEATVIPVILRSVSWQGVLVTITSSLSPNVYPPSEWNLLFEDSMKTNEHGWSTGGACSFTDDVYQISATAQKPGYWNYWCLLERSDFSNFALEVEVTIVEGVNGGIIFHASGNSYYVFYISTYGSYFIEIYLNNQSHQFLSYNISPFIPTGRNHSTLIAVIVEENTFYLYANKHLLTSVTDTTLGHGQVALFGTTTNSDKRSVKVTFSNVKVWTPSS